MDPRPHGNNASSLRLVSQEYKLIGGGKALLESDDLELLQPWLRSEFTLRKGISLQFPHGR